jgi:phosphorylcholine metabolism protein LicD
MNRILKVKGYEDYTVDIDTGEVYGKRGSMNPKPNEKGYTQIRLYADEEDENGTLILKHHLVFCASSGIDVIEFRDWIDKMDLNIHHIEPEPTNNSISNLMLTSSLENQYYKKTSNPFIYVRSKTNKSGVIKFFLDKKAIKDPFKSTSNLDEAIRFRNKYLFENDRDKFLEVIRVEQNNSKEIEEFRELLNS